MGMYFVKDWYCKPYKKGKTYQGIWVPKTFTTTPTSFSGEGVWTDGENTYYSWTGTQYVLDETASTWISKTWKNDSGGTYYPNPYGGNRIWTDGDNIYNSYYNTSSKKYQHYVLDKNTSTWSVKTWNGYTNFVGESVWTADGTDYYITSSGANNGYILDKNTSTWNSNPDSSFQRKAPDYIWKDENGIVYYSRMGTDQGIYKFDAKTKTWSWVNFYYSDGTYVNYPPDGMYVWTDGNQVYWDDANNKHYTINTSTNIVDNHTWQGLNTIKAWCIWTYKDHVYHSTGGVTYELT